MIPPDRDRAGGTSCTISSRFSSLKIAPGRIPSSADKWALNTTQPVELLSLKARTSVRTRQAVADWANFEPLARESSQQPPAGFS